jgi:hypothetical protein
MSIAAFRLLRGRFCILHSYFCLRLVASPASEPPPEGASRFGPHLPPVSPVASLPPMPSRDVGAFISEWKGATAPEHSISQKFLLELCDLAAQFARAKPADVTGILKTLETFGRARHAGEGKFKS